MPKDDWLKLAILYDETAKYSPSNTMAIDRFCNAAIRHQIYPSILHSKDINLLSNFNGLLIRDTTHPTHYTYEFAIAASTLGLKVIDSPMSIQQGCNKLWQSSLFQEHNISHPKTWMIRWDASKIDELTYPCVVKIPDSCFSQGVYKCHNKVELADILYKLWFYENQKGKNLVCQEFIETEFDWRIVIFNHKFLFAVKYYMVNDDWKIIKYDRKGDYIDGKHECVRFEDIPLPVLAEAEKCNRLLTDGLYGIDIKEVDNKAYVIEINDNPSIDGGVEDEIEGDQIYDTIVKYFSSTHLS